LIAVIEMSLSSWLVAGIVPGIERQPLKKLAVDESALLRLLHGRREEAEKARCRIERIVEEARLKHFEQAPNDGPHAMVRLLARVIGVGIETADMLVHEVLSRNMHDRRAIARYAGLTGSPDESGRKRREKGLARSGNGRVRRGMVQLAWRFLTYQKESALAQWYRARTENARGARKPMIVALARKLLIALWRFVWQGVVPDGVVLRPAQ
jgi:transposase